jgi:hypothetical protein
MILSCKTVAQISKELDLRSVPQIVPVQNITFNFDSDGEIINSADKFIEVFLQEHFKKISNSILTEYNIVLDEKEFLSSYEESQALNIFEQSDHYLRKWYSWGSKKIEDFRAVITIYDSSGNINVNVEICRGGTREFPEYLIGLPIEINIIGE